jgi:MFS family permease
MASMRDNSNTTPDTQHARLQAHPTFWAAVGVIQTLLTAGIIFGWASLLPVMRQEGVDHTPQEFSLIFASGAVGNYLSTLFFGFIVDQFGPRKTGIVASILFALGLLLASNVHSFYSLLAGVALLGFAGPGVQMPTLHLSNLFSNGSALFMSCQAAAFDGGTAVFALFRLFHQTTGLTSTSFLQMYLLVPLWVLLTAIFAWPDKIIEEPASDSKQQIRSPYSSPYMASPYRSPGGRKPPDPSAALVNAPLSTIFSHPAFYSLAFWVSFHILKLNFIVATLNDQLNQGTLSEEKKGDLINTFGAILPFGFVILPVIAYLLQRSALKALQLANLMGFSYGAVMVFAPRNSALLICIVFTSVATCRQLVYSTVFHQVGQVFGFKNYGVLLGSINILVSAVSMVQIPLVKWSESIGTYSGANKILWWITFPLFLIVFWSIPRSPTVNDGEREPLRQAERKISNREVLAPIMKKSNSVSAHEVYL